MKLLTPTPEYMTFLHISSCIKSHFSPNRGNLNIFRRLNAWLNTLHLSRGGGEGYTKKIVLQIFVHLKYIPPSGENWTRLYALQLLCKYPDIDRTWAITS